MSWTDARRKFLELAASRTLRPAANVSPPGGGERSDSTPSECGGEISLAPVRRAHSICVASGKGGTGKSVVTAALAQRFSLSGRALVVDADMGVGNAHILHDVQPARSFVDVVEGEVPVRDVLVHCDSGIDLLAAGSGVPRMAELSAYELHLIASGLAELETSYDTLIVDSAAGISRQTLAFARSCDEVLLVTTPDLTAMTDAYAFLKVLTGRQPGCEPLLVVNRARSQSEADEVSERIGKVARRFLGRVPRPIGWLPDDPCVQRCVNRRGAVTRLEPRSPAARALRRLSVELQEALRRVTPGGLGRTLLADSSYF